MAAARYRANIRQTAIAGFQVLAASAIAYAISGLPAGLVFDADGTGGCPGTEPREVCGTPTAATSGTQTVTVTAQDADANRAAGDRATLAFQVSMLANLAASPAPCPCAAARSIIQRSPAKLACAAVGAASAGRSADTRRTCAVNSRDLLETARRLAQPGAALPTQADLRRAVSTAYYALFHCLAAAAADLLTGSSSRGPEWHQVYRALEHGKAKRACRQQRALRAFPMEIRRFAEMFVDLQEARHEADYALEGQYLKQDVLAIIGTAEDAINEFEQAGVRHRRGFAVHVLFKRRQP